ncbi:MAG: glycosyltransferase [Chloroflexi bacterium]|nr:glycosyltransferase [Chloroflexota bacterium]
MAAKRYTIAFLIDGLSMGGAERLMVPILKHLSRDDFEPRVCVFQTKEGNPMAESIQALGVPVDSLEINRLRDISALPRLTRYLKENNVKLVHTQLEFANILGNIAAKFMRLPSVCTVHVLPPEEVKLKTKFHQRAEWTSLRMFCDRIISVSEEARTYHLDIAGFWPEKITTIYNGIDLMEFRKSGRADRNAIRQELGIPENANLMTTVAVLRQPKGIEFMIRALPAVLAADPLAYYLVVGSGPHHDVLIEEVAKVGVKDRVIFAGLRKDVPDLLAASDLFVLPTLTEALPTVLAEAMAVGLPIVASAVGGVPEMVTDGANGRLVSPGVPVELSDACIDLLSSPEKRKSMGSRGLEIVDEKFSIDRQVGQMRELYLDLLSRHE